MIYRDADTLRSYSYNEVKRTTTSFGQGLIDFWGWQEGDVLALFTPNCVDTPAVIWGCHWAGGIVTTANPGYTADELAFQLRDAGAKALVTQKKFLATAQAAAKKVGIPEDRIILMGDERDRSMKFKHFQSICKNVENSTFRRKRRGLKPEKDLAFLVYSSGTTGHPKGVMLSHRNIIANVLMGRAIEGEKLTWNGGRDGMGDNILAFLPFFHIYGLLMTVWKLFINFLTFSLRSDMLGSQRYLQRGNDYGDGTVRDWEILLHSPESPDILCICRSSGDPAPWKASGCQKIWP